jgi:hypothetical protein
MRACGHGGDRLGGQNEVEDMKKLGLDILPHRRRLVEDEVGLDERFKDPADPLAMVFVCAMWLTGFDAPSCTTVYLDKPMRNHTLMQTITRANRVFPGKHSGLIVDYANVFTSLEKASGDLRGRRWGQGSGARQERAGWAVGRGAGGGGGVLPRDRRRLGGDRAAWLVDGAA